MAERRKFSDYEKKTIYAKSDGKCEICGRQVKFKDMTVDHKIPLTKGGTNELENLQLAHLGCNRAKADMLYEEFLSLAQNIVKNSKRARIKSLFAR